MNKKWKNGNKKYNKKTKLAVFFGLQEAHSLLFLILLPFKTEAFLNYRK